MIRAMEAWDVKEFDAAFWGHLGHVVRNLTRALVLSLSRGRLAGSAGLGGPPAGYVRKLAWASASSSSVSSSSR